VSDLFKTAVVSIRIDVDNNTQKDENRALFAISILESCFSPMQ
jgi:hypothetical protein